MWNAFTAKRPVGAYLQVQLSFSMAWPIVVGGKPPPRVVWYKNSQLFSEQFVREEDVMTGQLVTYNNLSLLAIPRYEECTVTGGLGD